ncbi:MAG: BASS family bile acid:Na+ symporter [Oleispira sp.]|jgi:BASS family bile acid:Na+ symporter
MPELHYDGGQQWILNLTLAMMVLGLALDIHPRNFLKVFKDPKAPAIGLVAQFILLPAFTCGLTLLLDLPAGIELGMILVAACPGGALSNFITHLSGGNTALSISITAISSTLAIVMLPINFVFWASLNPVANALLLNINVSGVDIAQSLLVVLAAPLALGFLMQHHMPNLSKKLHTILKYVSLFALVMFIFLAVFKNYEHFIAQFWLLFIAVFAHNMLAMGTGYAAASFGNLPQADKKAITLEVGMQNSALAIAIVFTQFNGEYGMALISAFWGTWHIVSGITFAGACHYMSKKKENFV